MIIKYQLTDEDIERFHLYRPQHSDTEKGRRRTSNWIISSLFLLVGILILLDSENLLSMSIGVLTILLGLLLIVFYDRYFYWKVKRATRRMLTEGSNEGLLGEYQFTLGDDVVTIKSPIGSVDYRGDFLDRVTEDEHCIYCFTSSITAELVPKRAFKSEHELEEFREAIRRFLVKR